MPSVFSRFIHSLHALNRPRHPPGPEKDENIDEKASQRGKAGSADRRRALRISLDLKSRFHFRSSSSSSNDIPQALHITVTLDRLPSPSSSPDSALTDPPPPPLPLAPNNSSSFFKPLAHNPRPPSASSLLPARPTGTRNKHSVSGSPARHSLHDPPTVSTLSSLPSAPGLPSSTHVSLRKWGKVRIRPSLEDVFGPIIPLRASSAHVRSGSTSTDKADQSPYQLHPPPIVGFSPSTGRASNCPVLPPLPQAQPLDFSTAFIDWVDDSPTQTMSVHLQRRHSNGQEAAHVPFPSLSLEAMCALTSEPTKLMPLLPNGRTRRRLISAVLPH